MVDQVILMAATLEHERRVSKASCLQHDEYLHKPHLPWWTRLLESVHEWLHQILFRKRLLLAYQRFETSHRRWSQSLFDRYFVTVYAANVLKPIAMNCLWPSANDLARAYLSQFGKHERSLVDPDLVTVADEFLGELRSLYTTQAD